MNLDVSRETSCLIAVSFFQFLQGNFLSGPKQNQGPPGTQPEAPRSFKERLLGPSKPQHPPPGTTTDHYGQPILEHDDNYSDRELYPNNQGGYSQYSRGGGPMPPHPQQHQGPPPPGGHHLPGVPMQGPHQQPHQQPQVNQGQSAIPAIGEESFKTTRTLIICMLY